MEQRQVIYQSLFFILKVPTCVASKTVSKTLGRAPGPAPLVDQKKHKQGQKQKCKSCSFYICGTGMILKQMLACTDMDRAAEPKGKKEHNGGSIVRGV